MAGASLGATSAPAPKAAAPRVDASIAGTSFVHLGSSHPGTWLELESDVDRNGWRQVCAAPCDRSLTVAGTRARVSAPGMTTSNPFRIEPGPGTALIRVDGGSAKARSLGILGLAVGIPVTLGGGALYGYGAFADHQGPRIAGAIVLGTGALAVLVALPLLLSGATTVRDAHGSAVARASGGISF